MPEHLSPNRHGAHHGERPFAHVAGTGSMLRLALLNFLLNVLTLSLWRFWAKTRVRRLLWSGTAAWGDHAEYTGRGGELFLGFVVVMVSVFMPILVALTAAQMAVEAGNPWGNAFVLLIQAVAVFLAFAGLYRARRYQLSRTLWRGIRAGQDGEAWRYGLMVLGCGLVNVLSLGWAWPWAEMTLARYRLGNTRFGDERFVCTARARGLYRRFAVMWGVATLVLCLPLVTVLGLYLSGDGILESAEPALLSIIGLLLAGGVVLVLALPYAWYRAAVLRQLVAGTRFAGTTFHLDARTAPLLRLGLGNWLIGVLSLGILRPWAALREFRFVCANLSADCEPDWSSVRQSAAAAPRLGEGLAAVFDGAGEF